MGLDLLLAAWLIITGLLGFRDGVVRKLTSLVLTGVALFVGHMFMREAGSFFVETLSFDESLGPTMGFMSIFIGIVLVQSIAYKIATESFKIGGFADRVAGAILGVFQGILFLSSILYILAYIGTPSASTTKYSKIYRSVVNVAPQLLDLFTTVQTSSYDELEALAREKGAKSLNKMMRPGSNAADTLKNRRLLNEVRERSAAVSGGIDSLRKNARR